MQIGLPFLLCDIYQCLMDIFVLGITLEIPGEIVTLLNKLKTAKDITMNTLTALTLTATFSASLFSAAAVADDLVTQVRADTERHLIELRHSSQHQAKLALSQTVIDLLARQAADQDSAALKVAQHVDSATDSAGE